MSTQDNKVIRNEITQLREQLQDDPTGPDARTATLIHTVVKSCRRFTTANDMTGLTTYLSELDSQATGFGAAVSYQTTARGGAGA